MTLPQVPKVGANRLSRSASCNQRHESRCGEHLLNIPYPGGHHAAKHPWDFDTHSPHRAELLIS